MSNTHARQGSCLWVRLGWSLVLALLVAVSFSDILDDRGSDYTQAGFKRALATFAIARGLNGVISVAQGTEVVLQPVGFGVTLTPGEILDPVNDLIERFSWVMLASTTSLGIQEVLLEMVSWPVFSLILAALALIWLLMIWRHRGADPVRSLWISRLMVLALLIRFSIPMIAMASEGVYHLFLQDRYEQAAGKLEETIDEVDELNSTLGAEDDSLVDRAKNWVSRTKDKLAVGDRMERYKATVAHASENTINLIVVFVVQTILLPLFFFWFFFRVIRNLFVGLVSS